MRLFHWLLAGAFLSAFAIAAIGGEDGRLFPLHALLGLTAAFLVVLRVLWGVIGSRWARFASLELRPSSFVRHLREAFGPGAPRRFPGHNPATSWFLLAAIVAVLGLAVTGVMSARGIEPAEEVHQVLAWSLLVLAAAHVAGVVWHRIRRRENLAVSMLTGYKDAEASAAIRSWRPVSAAALLLLSAAFGATLAAGYDPATGRLAVPFLTGTLRLTEAEGDESARHAPERDRGGDEDHDDKEKGHR